MRWACVSLINFYISSDCFILFYFFSGGGGGGWWGIYYITTESTVSKAGRDFDCLKGKAELMNS